MQGMENNGREKTKNMNEMKMQKQSDLKKIEGKGKWRL